MFVPVQNQNYGYSVATNGLYVGVGNPALTRYTLASASFFRTGSFEVFRYDVNSDSHVYVDTVLKPYEPQDYIILDTENLNYLETELLGLDQWNRGLNIAVDNGIYLKMSAEDAYGKVLDCYNGKIAAGCEYYWDQVVIGQNTFNISSSCVDVWDYTYTTRNVYSSNAPCTVVGHGVTGSLISTKFGDVSGVDFGNIDLTKFNVYYQKIQVPPGYDAIQVFASSSVFNPASLVTTIPVTPIGEYVTYAVSASFAPPAMQFAYGGVITNQPVHQHILNPDPTYSSSFGHSVSINDQWLVIGSPMVSSSQGMVYVYQGTPVEGFVSYSLYQKISPPTPQNGQLFGWSVALNKDATFACPNRFVVGAGTASNNSVAIYELSNSIWAPTFTFIQNTSSLYPLTFNTGSLPILASGSYQSSSFGWSVAIWDDTVVIGAPTERMVYEYSSSAEFNQGTAYIFERCPNYPCGGSSSVYQLVQKVYGDQNILRNNQVGYSVGVYGTNMVIGAPKIDFNSLSSAYLSASIFQLHYCSGDAENSLTGQWIYLTQDTASNWNYQKTFQKKKKFMSPYRGFGESVSVGDMSIVIGAPMAISDLNRSFFVPYTSSLGIDLDDLMGKAYIYNLKNFHNQIYVGNVFYKNGIVVVNTSGSAFQGLFFNPTTPYTYQYDLTYQSQHTIHEKQIICTVNPGEFNVSTNPSAIVIPTSSWDINNNGEFDFQDADILLRYIQYRNTVASFNVSFDWSSSILHAADEISFYNYQSSLWQDTELLFSSSLQTFEANHAYYDSILDVNQDNRVDLNDQNLIWKYYSKRLTEKNFLPYVNSNSSNKNFNAVVAFMDSISQRNALLMINSGFASFDAESASDKTGSFLAPMVTTVGLYDGLDLVAVAKLAVPIKLPKTLPINFVIKLDF